METIAVVYNNCYGGFGLSDVALFAYNEKRTRCGLQPVKHYGKIPRTDPMLVDVVRELGKEANGFCAKLKIEDIPGEYATCFKIHEYDGLESVECDPKDLVAEQLKSLNIDEMSDNECRQTLISMIKLVNPQ